MTGFIEPARCADGDRREGRGVQIRQDDTGEPPSVLLRVRADQLGRNPRSDAAFMIFSRLSAPTLPGFTKALETNDFDTPAATATSLTVGLLPTGPSLLMGSG